MTDRRSVRYWLIGVPTGLIVNGVLVALLLIAEKQPDVAEPLIVVLSLERLARPPADASRNRAHPRSPLARPDQAEAPLAIAPSGAPPPPAAPLAPPPPIEPRWAVAGGAYADPASAQAARRAWNDGDGRRLLRACGGLTAEHMTDEEKDRCFRDWARAAERNAGRFGGGPVLDSVKRDRFDAAAAQQERCRRYRSQIVPGTQTESVLRFGGVADPPRLRDGGC